MKMSAASIFHTQIRAWCLLVGVATVAAPLVCPAQSQKTNSALVTMSKSALIEFAMQRVGDAARGKQIFADEARAACVKCHTTDGHGVKAGPDLSAIGDKFP